jgi:hypothetical protein
MVSLLRMPGLNMMSHNRFVFAASFSVLALAAVGLDALSEGACNRRWWFWLPATVLGMVGVWCVGQTLSPPELMVGTVRVADVVRQGQPVGWITSLAQVQEVRNGFSRCFLVSAALCGLGMAAWFVLCRQAKTPRWLMPALGAVLLADLLWFAFGRSAQCDWSLYYPPIPVLEKVAKSTPGRIIGYHCLPAALAQTLHLRDIRGYDAVDPARLIDLMSMVADARTPVMPYALTQWLIPKIALQPPATIRLHPVLDMLNVRYVIFRGSPPADIHPDFVGDDYWVLTNTAALSRTFIPLRVETVADDKTLLSKMADVNFSPQDVAYLETPVNLPADCRGSAEIVDEIPTKIKVSAKMETAGLLVLADLWDRGWNAYVNGRLATILRANHAVRGVELPAGESIVEFRYEPASLAWGLRLAGLAFIGLLGWVGVGYFRGPKGTRTSEIVASPPTKRPPAVRRPAKRR